ncbi:MAG: histidine--tRNA ligase [Candidatus Campbellbacteria bacterium]|nr:histidine--tRNA ligase [Candidatus Campbellbacteria bacterium]
MKKIPESYKGVKDFFPGDAYIRNYIISVWSDVLEVFGYQQYDASVLEEMSLYKGKTSEEIMRDQIYSFKDRGKRDVVLRPEMTPTTARMIAKLKREKNFRSPVRWYSIPNLFRYERPQKGRLREHWQLNVDIFGVEGIEAEAELISIAETIFGVFGLTKNDVTFVLNDRNSIDKLIKKYVSKKEKVSQFINLLDKKQRISEKEFKDKAVEIIGKNKTKNLIEEIDNLEEPSSIKEIRKMCPETSFVYNPFLVRGFDYYTGVIIEVYANNPKMNRSLLGGGRYDNLVGTYGEEMSACGFGMGNVMLKELLEEKNLLPKTESSADVYIVMEDKELLPKAKDVAEELRAEGIRVAIDYSYKKKDSRYKKAETELIPFILTIDDSSPYGTIRDIETRKDKKIKSVEDIIDLLCEKL